MTRSETNGRVCAVLTTPFGALGVLTDREAVAGILFLPPGSTERIAQDALGREVCAQLRAYLRDPAFRFELPLAANGTRFQQRVWNAIRAIPLGEVRRYGELSKMLGSAAQAVGQACGANPLPLLVPCHRVVSASGIGGFARARGGYLLDTKTWLLRHEGVRV